MSESKKKIGEEEWEEQLKQIVPNKSEMNKLIMNFLVVEGYKNAAMKFEEESGVKGNYLLNTFS